MTRSSIVALAVAALAACPGDRGSGPSRSGPGDVQNHVLLDPGSRWRMEIRPSAPAALPGVTTAEITGTQEIGALAASVLATRSSDGSVRREYYAEDDVGLRYLGNDDPTDAITPIVVPFYELRFPLAPGASFTMFDRDGLDSGADLDGDHTNERLAVRADAVVTALEDVAVPAGRFASCARVRTTTVVKLRSSSTGQTASASGTEEVWWAPGVGPVKRHVVLPLGEIEDQELAGYSVGGERHGVVADAVLATALGPGDSNMEDVGRPAIAFHDAAWLLATSRAARMGPGATRVSRFDATLAPLGTTELDAGAWPALAWNGAGWLLCHGASDGRIHAHQLDAAGAPVRPPVVLGAGYMPVVASDGTGSLVVWAEFMDGREYDIRGALVGADGSTAGPFTIIAAPGEQVFPAVAFDGRNYLVAWRDTRSGSGPASDTHLYAARVTPAGVLLDPDGFPIATGPGIADTSAIASNGSGTVVVWLDYQSTSSRSTLRAARVGQDGAVLDGSVTDRGTTVVSGDGIGWPAVVLAGSDYRVAWTRRAFDGGQGVWTARLSQAGALLDARPLRIASPPDRYAEGVAYAALASDGSAVLAAWLTSFREKTIDAALVFPPANR